MPKALRLTPGSAERLLFKAGFTLLRTRGSHRIYGKGMQRCTVPFHAGRDLHPKLVKQILQIIKQSGCG